MKLEVKRLETCYGGEVYICLDDYAETNSIKCKVANIGEEIIPNKFTYDGTPYFSYDIFKKYSKENPYAKIYVEVEYEPKELELNSCMYNTAFGISDYIKDLSTLNHIMNIRSVAHCKKNIRLNEFVWRGILKFDQFGQTMSLSKQEYTENIPLYITTKAIDMETFNMYCKGWNGTFKWIPKENDICPKCNNGWTIDNISDYTTTEDENYKILGFHKDCLKKYNNKKQLNEFKSIFLKIYNLDELKFEAILNEYCSCDHCSSWFIVSTPDGDIKIGWRKRVINIEWLENYKLFREKFETEDVTRGFGKWGNDRYIHAWGVDKAIEYLFKAKDSIRLGEK